MNQPGSYEIVTTTEKAQSIKDFVSKIITSLLGKTEADGVSTVQPLMEMGLDSEDLLELKQQISSKYQIQLEPAFFFKYHTADLVISYLQEQVNLEEDESAVTIKEPETTKRIQENYDQALSLSSINDLVVSDREIAIIGIACRLPGGIRNKEQLWELITNGKDAINKIPSQRWSWPPYIHPDNEHKGIDLGGFIDDISSFDALFFRISPKEAEFMDPQQRILLELSWECFEDAGCPTKEISGSKTGVFIGASSSDYNTLLSLHLENIDAQYNIGTSMAMMPNRISYFYNFHGPSMLIDTACSSSLVAVHEAVKSLQNGECEQAIVGGINIMCHPSATISYYKAGMLAKDGRCKTFDKYADGYVRGEGGAIILLKPLRQALADQDSICAVIKGTAVNHGGQAGGLTVPNPAKQADLLVEAFKTAVVEPETIGYIEAHGTGTSLGDPVEISGLIEAFEQLSKTRGKTQSPYCGLSSIKTNIGHLEAAAGIAGLIKAVLCLQHQTLPASLNFNELNPHINLDNTPFYIVNKNLPWLLPDGQLLRRAGVNSFGSGGANAHVVLEEGTDLNRPAVGKKHSYYLICLSAKTEEVLRQKEQYLSTWLDKAEQQHSLTEISATLLLGRDHFGIRAAYVVRDIQELQTKLKEVQEKGQAEGYFKDGDSKKEKQLQLLFKELGQTILQELRIGKQISKEKYYNKMMALAELYAKGYNLDWKEIFGDAKAPSISLPTYPFSKEHYWIPEPKTGLITTTTANLKLPAFIHPFLHQNTSDLMEQRFTSTFTGQEYFLAHHVVKGQRVLPEVACLEMARVAAEQATGALAAGQTMVRLKNIVWAHSIVVDTQPVRVDIRLFPADDSDIAYEIYGQLEKADAEPIVYSQGKVELGLVSEALALDLAVLKAQCDQNLLMSSQCYEVFKEMGVEYGPGYQGVKEVYVGHNQVLAKLVLPSFVSNTQDLFILHPSIIVSAFQTSLYLVTSSDASLLAGYDTFPRRFQPLTLQEIQIFNKCVSGMWAWVRYSDCSMSVDKLNKFDIDLCDDYGNVCVRMKGLDCQAELVSTVSPHLLPPITIAETIFSNISEKPKGISLQSLLNDQVTSSKLGGKSSKSIKLPSTGISLAQPRNNDEFQTVTNVQTNISLESLQEDLLKSLAEALYMKQSDIDVDKKFIDLGLDSIIGVEWVRMINKQYGTSIPATKVYDYPNIREFAGFMTKELKNALQVTEISPENTEKELTKKVDTVSESALILDTFESSAKQRSLAQSSSRFWSNQNINKSCLTDTGLFYKIRPVNEKYCFESLDYREAIAIIGMSGRYPGASNLGKYWDNLVQARNSIREIPKSRWDVNRYYDPRPLQNGKIYCKWLGLLDDIEYFDPLFFNISPSEAEIMDPQHRIFLQEGYKAFEDAGYSYQLLSNAKCGIYLGIMSNEYGMLLFQNKEGITNITGNSFAIAAARISYYLNLKGPAISIDTACSSSLVATHLACQALSNREIDMALVGGVTLYLTSESYIGMCATGMLSPDGQCKTFDNGANGFVPGEGVGALVLKRLKDAQAERDHIYGVIIGSGINQDGKTNGITAPSVNSQMELEHEVYAKYQINPESISYVEMHGTGTKLGDPIELEALSMVFKEQTNQKNYCAVGSVKSNIGHTSAAAGVASMQKVLLSMKHKKLVPTLNFKKHNEHFNFADSPFYVNTELRSWEAEPNVPRRAAVSSFGFSGTNAHVVIEEYIPKQPRVKIEVTPQNPAIIVLSAKNEDRLREQVRQLLDFIQEQQFPDDNLADMAYTLQAGREAMEERLAVIVESMKELEEKLKGYLEGRVDIEHLYHGQVKRNKEPLAVFTTDEELKEAADKWIQRGKYARLLDYWVKGLTVDWNKLYAENKPRRISLPTYPFARERCWFAEKAESENTVIQTSAKLQPQNQERAILVKDWQKASLTTGDKSQPGIVFVMGTQNTAKLASALLEDMQLNQVIQIVHGETQSPDVIFTDFYSASAGDDLYEQVNNKLKDEKLLGVIDVTAFDPVYEQSTDIESGKIRFLQRLIEHNRYAGIKLLQVTYQLHPLHLAKTTMQGARLAALYRMLSAEYKQIQAITMDTDCSIQDYKSLSQQILREFGCENHKNITECCYRNGERYQPELTVAQTADQIKEGHHNIPKKYGENDVVLITGGSRGIGASVADYVVGQGVKKLVIMGRQELPEPSQWKRILANKIMPEIEEKIKRMQLFIDRGVKVYYYSTALSDEMGITSMLHKIHHDLGSITGVFHCAGLISKNPAFLKKNLPDMGAVYEPKVKGLVTLHNALKNEPLDFFVLFSSISSIAPTLSVGQSDYAMANAYMDYYALHQAGEGKPYFKSIQWPAWGETGMTVGGMLTPAYMKAGFVSLTTEDGLAFLDIIMKTNHIVSLPCVVIPGEFSPDYLLKTEAVSLNNELVVSSKKASKLKPEESLEQGIQDDLRESVVRWLHHIFMSELKLTLDQLNDDKPFDEYGVDSIILVQLTQTLQEKVNSNLVPSLLLEYCTITALADYFTANHAETFQKNRRPEKNCVTGNNLKQGNAAVTICESVELAEDIAIIGLSCRFPGSPTKETYWDLLTSGVSVIKPVSKQRWVSKDNRIDFGGWVDNIDLFDPKFFNINEDDAAIMDPQARIILEESLRAIYDAGYEHKQLSQQKIGVFIGGRSQPNLNGKDVRKVPNPILGIGQNYLAANISRFFNFKGPSLVVDTACSSGITGMLFAVDSLRVRRIDMALVGAVSLLLSPSAHDIFAARNILSKNGQFHIFDKQSDGEVLGEGTGVVILKRFSDAVRDGNQIYGVIKSISVNNDGRTLGPGSPDINAQKQVIQDALTLSGKQPADIGYIEVNGGGSPVVDSIEIKALSDTYELSNQKLTPCFVGSIKPNIGHLLLASGLAGFIRCVLSVYHKQIPPFLSTLDPFNYYDFAGSRIRFNRQTVDWQVAPGNKRIAAQNSFPDGGTNCHVIVEEFVPSESYQQQYFPMAAPNMEKKRFPLGPVTGSNPCPTVVERQGGLGVTGIFKGQSERKVKQQDILSIKNVWGKYDEKSI